LPVIMADPLHGRQVVHGLRDRFGEPAWGAAKVSKPTDRHSGKADDLLAATAYLITPASSQVQDGLTASVPTARKRVLTLILAVACANVRVNSQPDS
jgi:hypothetical protein